MTTSQKDIVTIDIVFMEGRAVFPYEATSIKARTYNRGKVGNLGVLFKSPTSKSDSSDSVIVSGNERYEKIGTLLKVIDDSSEVLLTGSSLNVQRRLLAIGVARFEVLKLGPGENEACIRVIQDEISKEEEEKLKKSNEVEMLREKTLALLTASEKGISSSELSKRNFIYNEENLIRLTYLCAVQIKPKYEEAIEFLKLNTVRSRIDYLLKLLTKVTVKDMVFDQNFTFDVSNPADLLRVERMVQNLALPEVAKNAVRSEITRLKKQPTGSQESSTIQNYLEFVLGLPWNTLSTDNLDLKRAQQILDEDHAGLNKVKLRIIEFLAIRQLNSKAKGSIICFQGPPGVGKTSLGKSIARALGRKYERISLGGISDESMLRGHRRTYVGAYAGTIIQAIRRAGTRNPVLLLDEIDKVGAKNYHGDPSAALLEILDPQQNNKFVDHFINLPFDLSEVFFIATANSIDNMHPALLDRMDVINLPGYSLNEKKDIGLRYLLTKVEEEHGLPKGTITIDDAAFDKVIKDYTMEAGVRNLEKRIQALCRSVAVDFVREKEENPSAQIKKVVMTEADIVRILGAPKIKEQRIQPHTQPGTAFGLAWTEVGGKVLLIETSACRGSGKIVLTGQLGDVIKESVSTALSWIKSSYKKLNLKDSPLFTDLVESSKAREELLDNIDIHVHFPSAATPKDGPSAGTAICVALVSLLTGKQVSSDIAMTGEISLTGKILPVGGIKEKVLAASTAGIIHVIIPEDNRIDFEKIDNKKDLALTAYTAKHIWQVLERALDIDAPNSNKLEKAYAELQKL